MQAGLIGMNYKLCDLDLRELFAKKTQTLFKERPLAFPLVVLSTCNRTELYFSSNDLAESHSVLLSKLKAEMSDFADHSLYSYFGEKCFSHLAKVTSGLDSVIIGEGEIQRQVKEAYESASLFQEFPSDLHFMFQKSLKIGKDIRTEFNLPKTQVSIESVLGDIFKCFFKERRDLSILFVGFSEINRKIIPFLKGKGFSNLHLITRNVDAAEKARFTEFCTLHSWWELSSWPFYEAVICGSLSSEYLLTQGDLKGKQVQSKLLIDLSLPRNIDPALERHPSIALFNIEEINFFVSQKQEGMIKEKQNIKSQIAERVSRQISLYQEKQNKVFVCA